MWKCWEDFKSNKYPLLKKHEETLETSQIPQKVFIGMFIGTSMLIGCPNVTSGGMTGCQGRPRLSHLKITESPSLQAEFINQGGDEIFVFSVGLGVLRCVGIFDDFWDGVASSRIQEQKGTPNQNWQYSSSHSHGSWKWLPPRRSVSFTIGSFSTEL